MKQTKAMDLGQLQTEVENATADLKRKQQVLKRASEAEAAANERYSAAIRALKAGFDTVKAASALLP